MALSPSAGALAWRRCVLCSRSPSLVLLSSSRLQRRVRARAPSPYLACVCLRAWAYHSCSFCALGFAVCVFGGGGVLSGGVRLPSLGFVGCPSYHHFFPHGLPIRYYLIPSMSPSAVLVACCSSCVLWQGT